MEARLGKGGGRRGDAIVRDSGLVARTKSCSLFSLSLSLPSITMDFVCPTCLVSKVPSMTPLSSLSIPSPPVTSHLCALPVPPVVQHDDVLLSSLFSCSSASLSCTLLPSLNLCPFPLSSLTHSLSFLYSLVTFIIHSRAHPESTSRKSL